MHLKEIFEKYDYKDILILDTETTGLDDSDQVLELCIIDANERVLFDKRFNPSVEISRGASRVHKIKKEDLKNADTYKQHHDQIMNILKDRILIIFNAAFDTRLIQQTAEAHGCEYTLDHDLTYCAMIAAAERYGSTNMYGSISLRDASYEAKIDKSEIKVHSAYGDTLLTLRTLKSMYKVDHA